MAREEGGEGPQIELGQKHEKTRLPPSHEHPPRESKEGLETKEERGRRKGRGPSQLALCRGQGCERGGLSSASSTGLSRGSGREGRIRVLAYI